MLPTNKILNDWFKDANEDTMHSFWFDKSIDKYITDTYKELVDSITIDNYKNYIHDKNDKISLLLIGDQFTRNIYRDTEYKTKNDIWALELAINIISSNKDLDYPLNYRYFILLPLRHAKKSGLLEIVYNSLHLYLQKYTDSISLMKFYNHTIKDFSMLTDTIKTGTITPYNKKFNTILEKYIKIDKEINFENIYDKCNGFTNIGLSLSGGVDSMVLLHALRAKCNVVAIHVEYCNRDEGQLEREFLEYYCNKIGVKLYYRTIDYMKRHDEYIDRTTFEIESRRARFNLYKYVIEEEKLEGICLGHHSGDTVENVFTNIIKGRSISDMTVMKEKQEQDNVVLFRPFLKLNKKELIEMAHCIGIPYFLNSTPFWSCRGVLRDNVIPILQKQFGDFESNIIKFTEEVEMYTSFYDKMMNCKFKKEKLEHFTKVEFDKSMEINSIVIEKLLLDIMHERGYKMVTHKCKLNFMNWLKGAMNNKIGLGKHMLCHYKDNYLYFVHNSK
jgi:tRNA(Ile)-lysidine synthetase-like protein